MTATLPRGNDHPPLLALAITPPRKNEDNVGVQLAPDEHRYLHNFVAANSNHDAKRAALDLALDLKRPVKPRWPQFDSDLGVNRQGCRFSRPAPWMARGGGPPNQCRITGTPSLGEVPSGGARAFCLLLRFSKVRRRKGGTHSSRYRSNGYVLALIQHPGRLSGRHREQAPLCLESGLD
ncbi:Threonine synthase [Pseudomonas sp. R2-37-08W]|nr:Threonine synthase [Pseudomonas sp. R2-37-08W]